MGELDNLDKLLLGVVSVDTQLLFGVLNFIGVEEGDVKAKVDSKFHGELLPGNL